MLKNSKLFSLLRFIRSVAYNIKNVGFDYQHFPFDTRAALPPFAAREMLHIYNSLKDVFDIRITDGTALGIIRDGRLIEHDNDLDYDIVVNSPNEPRLLYKLIKERGLKLGRIAVWNGLIQQMAFYDKENIIHDFLFWRQDDEFYVNFSELGYVRKQALEHYGSFSSIEFSDQIIKVPGNYEKWLISRYGETWNIPKNYKGDWKDDCTDLMKL